MNFLKEFLSSLKMLEVEEILDLIFYRPLAFLFVKIVYRTPITPNQVTWLAMLLGIIAGILFALGTSSSLLLGAILLILYDILDCSDGQLARLQNSGSLTGRIIDGFADYAVAVATYLGIGIGFASNTASPGFYWIMTAFAGASNAVHSLTLDYYRNQFLDYALDRKGILSDDLQVYETEYKRLVANRTYNLDRLLIWIYLKYSRLQIKFSSHETVVDKKYDAADYYKKNKLLIHLWTYIGPTTELTFMIICAFLHRWDIFLWGMISVANMYAIGLYLYQRRVNASLIKANVS